MLPDVKKAFEEAINKKVAVSRGDKTVLMTRVEIGLEQLLNQFAKGERHARRDLMEYADKLGIDFLAKHKQTLERALSPDYQAILDAAFARRSGNVAPATRVVASAELRDDDAAECEPAPPAPPPEPEPEPPPNPNAPKPFSRMTWTEKRAWYPEWFAEQEKKRLEQAKSSLQSPPRPSGANETIKETAIQEPRAMPPSQKLDQAGYGPGIPPPGGVSLTTGKPT